MVARVAYGRLTVERAPDDAASREAAREVVRVPGPGSYRQGGLTVDVAVTDLPGAPAVKWPLFLRGRLPGDRIRPERARGGKKLKAWLIDRKVPRERRDGLVVLADAAGNVMALPELGIRSAGAGSLSVTVRRAPDP
jgi:tRNA(Ile)-lysidine synthase